MNAKLKRTLTTLLLIGVTALPCALSFQHEARADNTVPIGPAETTETVTNDAPPALVNDHIAYIAGYPDGTMGPSRSVTRAEAVTFLYRLLADPDSGTGTCSYTDVNDGDWFAAAPSAASGSPPTAPASARTTPSPVPSLFPFS